MWTLVSVEIITDTTGKQMGRGGRGESCRVGDVIGGVESKRERRVREREREREGGERGGPGRDGQSVFSTRAGGQRRSAMPLSLLSLL